MPRLTRLDTGDDIATITAKQLAFLVEQLEDEVAQDMVIDRETLELFADNDIDPELLLVLEKALGDDDTMNIAWE